MEHLEDRRMLAVITVNTVVDSFDGSINDGSVSIRDAVHAANNFFDIDTIKFDPAVFGTPQTIFLSQALGDIEIAETIIIDGPGQQLLTIDALHKSRIFNITPAFGNFLISGLTLSGGRTTGSGTTFRGGAIRSLTVGNLTIDQSTIRGNSTLGSSADGGGIFAAGAVTLTSSTVSGNRTLGDSATGGGIFATGAVTLTNSTVSGNSTTGYQSDIGGIFAFVSVTLTNSTVSGNRTTGDKAGSGGIRSSGAVTLTNSTVSGNSTTGFNSNIGGIFANGAITLTNSTVSGNSTTGDGADGGGIISGGSITIKLSTITDNHAFHASATGGALWNLDDPISITNSIVSGNTAGGGMNDIRPGTNTLDINYSLIGTGVSNTSGNNIVSNNPRIGLLKNNGGPTETHTLLSVSPAIDAGDPSIASPPNFDQRGTPFVRVFGGRIDIGAYESQPAAAFPAGDYNHNGITDAADYTVWRDTLGSTTNLAADGNGNNVVDQPDYNVWKANFGNTTVTVNAEFGSGSAESGTGIDEFAGEFASATSGEEPGPVLNTFGTVLVDTGDAIPLDDQAHNTESRAAVSLDAETVSAVSLDLAAARPTFGIHDDLLLLALDRVGRSRLEDTPPDSYIEREDSPDIQNLDADPLTIALAEWL